jgi:hypothetical protein
VRTCSPASSTSTSASAGRACCSTSRSAAARASGDRRDAVPPARHRAVRLPRRGHRRDREAPRAQMRDAASTLEYERARVCATASRRCSGRSRSSRWSPTATRTST